MRSSRSLGSRKDHGAGRVLGSLAAAGGFLILHVQLHVQPHNRNEGPMPLFLGFCTTMNHWSEAIDEIGHSAIDAEIAQLPHWFASTSRISEGPLSNDGLPPQPAFVCTADLAALGGLWTNVPPVFGVADVDRS